jgi:hypothetical protein
MHLAEEMQFDILHEVDKTEQSRALMACASATVQLAYVMVARTRRS